MHKPGGLYDFQKYGVKWLMRSTRAYLADKPGLGKTVQAITAATKLNFKNIWVICPAIARDVWREHWRLWGSPRVRPHVVSYEWLVQHPEELQLIWRNADLVIGDEWHYAKNVTAKRSRAACRVMNRAQKVWLLSASPMPNNPSELYTTFRSVWPDILKNDLGVWKYEEYVKKFCIVEPVRYGGGRMGTRIVGVQNAPLLRDALSKIMLRRRLEDVDLELPELRWNTVRLDLTIPEWSNLASSLKNVATPEVVERIRQRLARNQMPNNPNVSEMRRVMGVAKAVPAVRMIAEEMDDKKYDKLVVMAYHKEVLNTLEDGLQRFGLVRTDGSTGEARRTSNRNQFQQDKSTRIFLGQLTTTGVAITLHAASEMVMVEQPWTPEDIEQIARRIHRIGQQRACRVRMFVLPDTIDDAVAAVRSRKLRMIGEVVHT